MEKNKTMSQTHLFNIVARTRHLYEILTMTSSNAAIILILVLVVCWSIKANDIIAEDDDIVSNSKQAFGYRPWAQVIPNNYFDP